MKHFTREAFEESYARTVPERTQTGTIVEGEMPIFETADLESNTLYYSYFPEEKTRNAWNFVHGGVICTLLDIAMGVSAKIYSEREQTPTISMQVSFLRPHLVGKKITIEVAVRSCTRHVCSLTAVTRQEGNEDACATATASYYLRDI